MPDFEAACREAMQLALGDVRAALASSEALLRLAGDDPARRIIATVAISHAASYAGDLARAVSVLREVAPMVPIAPGRYRTLLHNAMVQPLLRSGRLEEAHEAAALAVASARRLGVDLELAKTLVSRGAVERALGCTDRAAETLAEAGRLAADAPIVAAAAASNRAECLLDDERFDEALEAFSWAAERFTLAGHHHGAAIARGNIADLLGRLGRLDAASDAFERARRDFERTDAELDVARLSCEEGEMLAGSGALRAARDRYALALPVLERATAGPDLARACVALASVMLELGDAAGAREMLLRAEDAVTEQSASFRGVIAHGLARCAAAGGDPHTALRGLDEALAGAADRPVRRAGILLTRAAVLLGLGRHGEAQRCAEEAVNTASETGLITLTPIGLAAIARCARAASDHRTALQRIEAAAGIAERILGETLSPSARNGLSRRFAGVLQLRTSIALDAGADPVHAILAEDAFAPRPGLPDADDGGTDPDDRRVRASLERVSHAIVRASLEAGLHPDRQSTETLRDLHTRAALLSERLGGRSARLEPPDPEAILNAAEPGTAILHWFEEDARLSALLLMHDAKPAVHRRIAAVGEVRSSVRKLGLIAERASVGDARDDRAAWASIAERLGQMLIPDPLRAEGLARAGHVILRCPPCLGGIPWGAVLGARGCDAAVSEIPGLHALTAGHAPASDEPGVVLLAAAPSVLPNAEAEVYAAGGHWARPFIRVGGESAELLNAARHADVLHLATHGVFEPDRPTASRLWIGDRWVGVGELASIIRPGAVVVLSACHAGRTGGLAEDRAAIPSVFRGARAVVAPNWPIGDAAAAALFGRFHGQLSRGPITVRSVAAALRAAAAATLNESPHSLDVLGISAYGGLP
jgi:tetratricopeptide (TPR) repeat protein